MSNETQHLIELAEWDNLSAISCQNHVVQLLHKTAFPSALLPSTSLVVTAQPCISSLSKLCHDDVPVADNNLHQSYYTNSHNPNFPSCDQALETCSHVLNCKEAVQSNTLKISIRWFNDWLKQVGIEPSLHEVLVKYTLGRDEEMMKDIVIGENQAFAKLMFLGTLQDEYHSQRE